MDFFWVQYLTRFVLTLYVRESNPHRWVESLARFPETTGSRPVTMIMDEMHALAETTQAMQHSYESVS